MTDDRVTARSSATRGPEASSFLRRPLTARSVIASTLLGMEPPRLPAQLLVRSGELFGISEGTTRVAISRMLAAGELEPEDGSYRLAGHLLTRHSRQRQSRTAQQKTWNGAWVMAVVNAERRNAADRSNLREAMRRLKLAELREGVWLRPDNLDPDRSPPDTATLEAQCRCFRTEPIQDASQLAGSLWDLTAWSKAAEELRAAMQQWLEPLERGDTDALAPGFELSAAVLQHMLADPLLPTELLPADWPGVELRTDYDRYDRAFKAAWRDWFRRQPLPGR
ncbi:MAG: hypothetical protein N2037_04535 [Acidimicrobiales bacterium]|nr:hypothetical protein [Acidimicrobiales bacterium]